MNNEKYNVICLSNQLWDFPIWTNKRHVMQRLAAGGHKVLFVDPPINAGRVFYRQIRRGFWSFSRILTQVKRDNIGALVYTPINLLPLASITSFLHVFKILLLAKLSFDSKRKTVLWIYHVEIPFIQRYVKFLKYDVLVYDCVDNYAGFPQYNTPEKKEAVNKVEKWLAQKANVVFTTAPGLYEKLRVYNENTHYTPNVGDYERFKDVKKTKYNLPKDLENIPRPRIGFAGALDDYKFDAKLMRKIAEDHPNYSYVLIGPIGLKDKDANLESIGLANLPNVFFFGTKKYDEMPRYYSGFDAYIIPSPLSEYTVGGCFPVKFHEALAAGLPTIVADLPAYMPFKDVCYISKNYNEFSENIKRALEEDNLARFRERQRVAKENNWDSKVDKMLDIIDETFRRVGR